MNIRILGVCAAALIAVATVLPWFTVNALIVTESSTLWNSTADGLAMLILAGLVGWFAFRRQAVPLIIAGGLVLADVIGEWAYFEHRFHDLQHQGVGSAIGDAIVSSASVSTGVGLWLTVLAAVGAIAVGIVNRATT